MKYSSEQRKQILVKAESALDGLSEPVVSHRPAADRWSIKEVVGHLIDSAANNHQRFVRLQNGPIDLPGYDQRFWVEAGRYQSADFKDLFILWKHYNTLLLHIIDGFQGDVLDNVWTTPDGDDLTLGFIADDYYDHLQHHIRKIEERL